MAGLDRLTGDQLLRLETAVAVVESSLEDIDAFAHDDVDPMFRMLTGMSATQLRLGIATLYGILSLHRRSADG